MKLSKHTTKRDGESLAHRLAREFAERIDELDSELIPNLQRESQLLKAAKHELEKER